MSTDLDCEEEGTLVPLFLVYEYCVKNKIDWTCGDNKTKVWIRLGREGKRISGKTVRDCAIKVLKATQALQQTTGAVANDTVQGWFDNKHLSRPTYDFAMTDNKTRWSCTMTHAMMQENFTAKAATKTGAQNATNAIFLKATDKQRRLRMWNGLESYFRQLAWLCSDEKKSPCPDLARERLASSYMPNVHIMTIDNRPTADREIASWLLKYGELGYNVSKQKDGIPDRTVFGFGLRYADQKRQTVSSILLASSTGCLIYNCQAVKELPTMLTLLLQAGHVYKPSFNSEEDGKLLMKQFGIQADGIVNIHRFAGVVGWAESVGFSRLVMLFCQRYYPGTPRLYWNNSKSTTQQVLDIVLVQRVVSLALNHDQTIEYLVLVGEDATRLQDKLFEIRKAYTAKTANVPIVTSARKKAVVMRPPPQLAQKSIMPARIGFETFVSNLSQASEMGNILDHVVAESDL